MCRKIARDLTEASLSGAGLCTVAALAMMFLTWNDRESFFEAAESVPGVLDERKQGSFDSL
ncbi:hypothetical protein RchiOBHm_Chr2g0127211 [Rosa chinensis]|uniref:Uncharacterized protein n=1 Tax=Rosa chinensis TaxID=74649 RepID=A0A2P6RU20_ROSCH|nr:hypothetical protein RchiOBHm_Chr2g0127211 [Rosa chinensis]